MPCSYPSAMANARTSSSDVPPPELIVMILPLAAFVNIFLSVTFIASSCVAKSLDSGTDPTTSERFGFII